MEAINTAEQFAAVAASLPARNIAYKDMDCQAMMEHCLKQIGLKGEWKGSNHMYRDMAWVGTPEECRKKFGGIPVGAWIFIWVDDGGEAARGYRDGLGNANHVGVYTGQGLGAVHSSQSRGKVCESKFAGKTIANGGWNRVGLCKVLDYGEGVQAALGAASAENVGTPGNAAQKPTIRKGSRGDAVVQLQRILVAIGYVLELDGIFGQMTEEAVKTYQATHDLEADGIVGPMTWAELT